MSDARARSSTGLPPLEVYRAAECPAGTRLFVRGFLTSAAGLSAWFNGASVVVARVDSGRRQECAYLWAKVAVGDCARVVEIVAPGTADGVAKLDRLIEVLTLARSDLVAEMKRLEGDGR